MVGQLRWLDRGRGRPERGSLYGLPVLRVEAPLKGFWAERRLARAGRDLRRAGALRVLAPKGFDRWPLLVANGLAPVETDAFVQAQSAPLAIQALERRGVAPDRATVALRGVRAGREMARAAAELCPRVRHLVVSAPKGGRELSGWLWREFGIPVLPEEEQGQVALCFQAGCAPREETALTLYGPAPELAGLTLAAPDLAEGDRDDLPLLAALWQGGKLRREDIKIT